VVNGDGIRAEWETTKITLAALAEKHDIKLGTLKSWKSQKKKS
jgi:phage terminase small subunit